MRYVVSACLMGERCKWSGGDNLVSELADYLWQQDEAPLLVCPETTGGLPCPRQPAERTGERVLCKDETDVTAEYREGAELSLASMEAAACTPENTLCILQPRSPSCGRDKIYDGTFTGKLVDGNGVFVDLLRARGYQVMTPDEALEMWGLA